MPVKACYDSRT